MSLRQRRTSLAPLPHRAPTGTADDRPAEPPRRRPTARAVVLLVLAVLIGLRNVQLLPDVQEAIRVAPDVPELDDPALEALAVRVGVLVGALLSFALHAFYLSLAALIDRTLVRRPTRLPWPKQLGPITLLATVATCSSLAIGVLFGIVAPKEHPAFLLWLVICCVAVPRLTAPTAPPPMGSADRTPRRAMVLIVAFAMAALSLAL